MPALRRDLCMHAAHVCTAQDLGKPWTEVFESIDATALASASVAQVCLQGVCTCEGVHPHDVTHWVCASAGLLS